MICEKNEYMQSVHKKNNQIPDNSNLESENPEILSKYNFQTKLKKTQRLFNNLSNLSNEQLKISLKTITIADNSETILIEKEQNKNTSSFLKRTSSSYRKTTSKPIKKRIRKGFLSHRKKHRNQKNEKNKKVFYFFLF